MKSYRLRNDRESSVRVLNVGQGSERRLFIDTASPQAAPDLLALDWKNGQDVTLVLLGG